MWGKGEPMVLVARREPSTADVVECVGVVGGVGPELEGGEYSSSIESGSNAERP
jgi:hypothetical protein